MDFGMKEGVWGLFDVTPVARFDRRVLADVGGVTLNPEVIAVDLGQIEEAL